jgi:two-component system CheB/CheR fusion protein
LRPRLALRAAGHEAKARDYQKLTIVAAEQAQAAIDVATLTPRQHEILELVLIGTPSKNIAADLHISRRTVENHRAAIMKKTHAKSLPALGRIGLTVDLRERSRTEFANKQAQVLE